MYSEWASLHYEIQASAGNQSVLKNFSNVISKDIASNVIQSLTKTLGQGVVSGDASHLKTTNDVNWTMEVICYALTLPLTEQETVRDAVNIYCKWMSSMLDPKDCVPKPVCERPNHYMGVMLRHLNNLFVPRVESGIEEVEQQLMLCDRVLRTVQSTAKESTVMNEETWQDLLKFLMFICDALLSPPTLKDGIGERLCERILSVLFETWLLCCTKYFPTPPYWKTFRELCAQWRHHEALITQWHRINVVLTARLLKIMYGPDYPELIVPDKFSQDIPEHLSNECVAQSWFRFLQLLGDPVDLSRPHIISGTAKFMHMALTAEIPLEPHEHPCLRNLPQIFSRAMRALSVLVDSFLGVSQDNIDVEPLRLQAPRQSLPLHSGNTPPLHRKAKSVHIKGKSAISTQRPTNNYVSSSPSTLGLLTLESRSPYPAGRPRVNSVLHLLGAWLFNGALARVQIHGSDPNALVSRGRTASLVNHDLTNTTIDTPLDGANDTQSLHSYDEGRAEAYGALCRIFCSKQTGEQIEDVYLSRFYIALYYGLDVKDESLSGHVLSNIIFNCSDLLRIDLDGIMILLPQILGALEHILETLIPDIKCNEMIPMVELRKASIHLLTSVLCLPLHFKSLPIKHIFGVSQEPVLTYLSLKLRIIDLLINALTVEMDTANTHMLLGGLLLCVQDISMCDEAEQTDHGEDGQPPQHEDHSRDSPHGLFSHATNIVCNRLMATWKSDLNIALAAIEVLSGMAKVRLSTSLLNCKRTVNWLCEFIVYQCSRPAPLHSRDLHSMIVAAFQCLTQWLVGHEYLMMDKDCLYGVLEVVELGISGSKSQCDQEVLPPSEPVVVLHRANTKHRHDSKESKDSKEAKYVQAQNRASDKPKMKGDKELKPVSMRVKDAAESLLAAIMDRVGSFPPPCGPESVCSLLDEDALLTYCRDGDIPESGSVFKYFVLDGITVIALLEQPLGNDQDPLPTVTAIIRGPFGRHAWTMQLRHLPRTNKTSSTMLLSEPTRPETHNITEEKTNVEYRCFPEIVDQIPNVQADLSIPKLDKVMVNESESLNKLEGFIKDQVEFEKRIKEKVKDERVNRPYPDKKTECVQPKPCHDFQTARLFLSHYGFLSLEALKNPSSSSSIPPALVMLNTSAAEFKSNLRQLDALPCRTCDTVFVYYVKAGQKMPFEILNNVASKSNVSATFLEFLRSLGWPVDVKKHSGWTGHTSTSWKIGNTTEQDELYPGDTGGSLYDGRQQVLYWSDVTSEVAFVVPSSHTYQPKSRRSSLDTQEKVPSQVPSSHDIKQHSDQPSAIKPKTLDLDGTKPRSISTAESPMFTPLDGTTRVRRSGRLGSMAVVGDTKIFVVWLEAYEDHENFPSGDFLQSTHTGVESNQENFPQQTVDPPVYIIYIHSLQSGLFRIHMQGNSGRMHIAVPLVDGMVVSGRSLGVMVRQTAINICRRKRLDSEGYQTPHVRRKLKIKEMVDQYRHKMSEAEFYTALYEDANAESTETANT